MSSAATVDVEGLLAPIVGGNPSGEALRYTGAYDAIQEARRSDDPNLNQGAWKRDLKVANWREVTKLTVEALSKKSKDIQIAVWLTEALVKQSGFAGLRDGLRILRELHERYWDTLYPAAEDGDLEFRAGPIDWLNDKLPPSLGSIGLTKTDSGAESYSWLRWQESRAVDELGRKNPQAKAAAVAEGKIAGEQFDKAAAVTPKQFYEALQEDLSETCEECEKLATVVDQKFGRDAPSLLGIKKALEDCRTLVEEIVKKKSEPAPAAAQAPSAAPTVGARPQAAAPAQTMAAKPATNQPPAATQTPAAPNKSQQVPLPAQAGPAAASTAANSAPAARVTQPAPAAQAASLPQLATNGPVPAGQPASATAQNVPAAPPGLEPRDRADALRRLQAIAAFFHRTEPHSPVAYLAQRAARWGEMPLEQWLNDVISDKTVLAQVRETLGLKN